MSKLTLSGLGKSYRQYATPRERLLELLSGKQRHREHWALQQIELSVQQGEAVGIIGNNGAGKSTLLKIVSGNIQPTTGSVDYQGRLTAILELGTGFHPEFTGRENLYYAGALNGISRKEISKRYDAIIDFSELGAAIEQPIKTYSTGMVVRLAFSLVTMVDPDILIIDEALAVGDRNFQKKCIDRMIEIQNAGTTILFCSHSMHHINQFCNRALWLDEGKAMAIGDTASVVDKYIANNPGVTSQQNNAGNSGAREDLHCHVSALSLCPANQINRGQQLRIDLEFSVYQEGLYALGVAINQRETQSRLVAESSLENSVPPYRLSPGDYRVEILVDTGPLRAGRYNIFAGLMHESLLIIEGFLSREIQVIDQSNIKSPGIIRAAVEWDVENALTTRSKR